MSECNCSLPDYKCQDCLDMAKWQKLTSEQRVFALRWLKAEKALDPKKSIAIHNERDEKFPNWDFSPEDIPSKIWRSN